MRLICARLSARMQAAGRLWLILGLSMLVLQGQIVQASHYHVQAGPPYHSSSSAGATTVVQVLQDEDAPPCTICWMLRSSHAGLFLQGGELASAGDVALPVVRHCHPALAPKWEPWAPRGPPALARCTFVR